MRTCLVVLSLILVIEGALAWASGMPQLTAMLAGTVLVGGMASFWKRRGGEWGWAPLVILYIAAAVLAFGLRECGVLVATSSLHFAAWFFAGRAIRFGAPSLLPGTLDGRPGIFAVAFYGAMALAVVLVRGGVFPISTTLAVGLAFLLFVLGLAVMEMGRFLRMREGAPDRASRKRGIVARALALVAVLAGLFFLFAKPVPAAADGIVKMVLALQGKTEDPNLNADDMPELDDVPERDVPRDEQQPEDESEQDAPGQQRSGDSMSQTRSLPQQANLQGQHQPMVYVDLDSEAQAQAMAERPIYVRSSTLGKYTDGSWGRAGESVTPRWIFDRDDGDEDGKVSLPAAYPERAQVAEVGYKIYVRASTGAALLGLQGVSAFEMPQVLRYDDAWYRSPRTGNISYRAASKPLMFEDVIGAEKLRPGKIDKVYSEVPNTLLMRRIQLLLDKEMPIGTLTERLLWLKQYMASNYEYSTTIANPNQLDPLDNFLFEEKRGYCDFYATAAAVMVRMMGVPSRMGYGFSKAEFDGDKLLTFYEDGAHSWAEIFLEGQGWVVFDVTPSGADDGGTPPPSEPNERPDLSEFDQQEKAPFSTEGGADEPLLAEVDGENSAMSDLVSYLVFCAALIAFGLWYYLKRDEAREAELSDGRGAGVARNLPAYLAEFCRLLKSFGLDPQHGETIVEMMKSLRGAGVPVDGFEAMKRYHYSTHYEGSPADPKLERRFVQEVKAFLKERISSKQ